MQPSRPCVFVVIQPQCSFVRAALEKTDDPDDRTVTAQVKHEQAVNGFLARWRGLFDSMAESGEAPSDMDLIEMIESMSKKY